MVVIMATVLFFMAMNNAQDVVQLEQQLVYHPHNVSLLHQIADSYYDNAQYDKANAYYQQAVTETIDTELQGELYANIGASFAQQKQYQQALDAYEKVLTLLSQEPRAQHNIPILKELLKQQEEQQKSDEQRQEKCSQDKKAGDNNERTKQDQKKDNKDSCDQEQDKQQGEGEQKDKGKRDQKNQQAQDTHDDNPSEKNQQHDKNNAADKQQQQTDPDKLGKNDLQSQNSLDRSKKAQQKPDIDQQAINRAKEQIAQQREEQKAATGPSLEERVGKQEAQWLEQVAQHEKQGQQLLVQYQAQENQKEEYGAKNW